MQTLYEYVYARTSYNTSTGGIELWNQKKKTQKYVALIVAPAQEPKYLESDLQSQDSVANFDDGKQMVNIG